MATWEECNKPIDPIVPPPSPPEPSGDCPDLSNDTVAPDKMLAGITAHDSNGDEIEGTLTGDDFLKGTLEITNAFTNKGITATVLQWYESSSVFRASPVTISASITKTIKVPQGNYFVAVSYSEETQITNMSSGVVVGSPTPVAFGTSNFILVKVQATNATRSFTVGPS